MLIWVDHRAPSRGVGFDGNHSFQKEKHPARSVVARWGKRCIPNQFVQQQYIVAGVCRSQVDEAALRLVLQHVLPMGLGPARNCGFLRLDNRRLVVLLRLLLFKSIVKTSIDQQRLPQPTRQPNVVGAQGGCHPMSTSRIKKAPRNCELEGLSIKSKTSPLAIPL